MSGPDSPLEQSPIEKPTKPYRLTFMPMEVAFTVDPARLPYGHDGLPGSILDVALKALGEKGLEHSCGGVGACATCHVKVKTGSDSCNEASDEELDQLEQAPDYSLYSRLACLCVPNGSEDVIVEIPDWNRNAVSE